MKTIQVQPLTKADFAPYGEYYTMTSPDGHALCGEIHSFYPDRVVNASYGVVGFSPIVAKKPREMLVTQIEYHTTTSEMIMPSAGTPITDQTKAFFVPKNTLIKMRAGVWHLAPLPANKEEFIAMIVLPECTYANDCTVVNLAEDEQFLIVK